MKYLIDVNLPKYFSPFNSPEFTHIVDIDPKMADKNIWELAIKDGYIILTKDSDFYSRFIGSNKWPKVIHFQLGNTTLKELHEYFRKHWSKLEQLIQVHDFLVVNKDSISLIDRGRE